MTRNDYIIQTTQESDQWLARFSKKTGEHWKEGAEYTLLGLGVAENEEDSIYLAIEKALYTND